MNEIATIGNTKICLLAYVDDLALLENNLDTVKQHYSKLISETNKYDLTINDPLTIGKPC